MGATEKEQKIADLTEIISVQNPLKKINNSQGPFHFPRDGLSKTIGKTKPNYATHCKNSSTNKFWEQTVYKLFKTSRLKA